MSGQRVQLASQVQSAARPAASVREGMGHVGIMGQALPNNVGVRTQYKPQEGTSSCDRSTDEGQTSGAQGVSTASPTQDSFQEPELSCQGTSSDSMYVEEGTTEGVSATEDRETSGGSSHPDEVAQDGHKREDVKQSGKKALQGEVDIFGQFLLYQPTDLVRCKRCGRSTIAGKFAMHLSRCMGFGRNNRNS